MTEYFLMLGDFALRVPQRIVWTESFDVAKIAEGLRRFGYGNQSEVYPYPTQHAVIRWYLCFHNAISHSAVIMGRDVVSMVGGYDSSYATAQDYDLWERLSRVTRLANLPDVLLHLRRYGSSVGSVHFAEQRQNAVDISRRMMSGILGTTVPIGIVNVLRGVEACTSARLSAGGRRCRDGALCLFVLVLPWRDLLFLVERWIGL